MPMRTSMPPSRTIFATDTIGNIALFGRAILTKWLVVASVPPPTPTFLAPMEGSCRSATTCGDTALCVAPVSYRALYVLPCGSAGAVGEKAGKTSASLISLRDLAGYRTVKAVRRGLDGPEAGVTQKRCTM